MVAVRASRRLLCAALAVQSACAAPPEDPSRPAPVPPAVEVVELSADEARRLLADGSLTAVDLTRAYLARIAAVDDAGPRLNAVIELNPAAVSEAERLDAERVRGQARGPLHGLPVLIKDNIDVAGMVTSAGSLALADNLRAADAPVVARLRDSGAVILGKTNLSEWANFRGDWSTAGWSSRGGQTKNPYVLDRSPCGSSAGSGVAVAASLAALTVGTETNGSIVCPAAVNGVVGLKPTVGIVSQQGIVPIARAFDTAGPMGRTVTDVAWLFGAMADAGPAAAGRDYIGRLRADALHGRRIGVIRSEMVGMPSVDAVAERAFALIRETGASVLDVELSMPPELPAAVGQVMHVEFKAGLNAYLRQSNSAVRSLQALIDWNRAHAADVMPHFGQQAFERAQAAGPLTDADYLRSRAVVQRRRPQSDACVDGRPRAR